MIRVLLARNYQGGGCPRISSASNDHAGGRKIAFPCPNSSRVSREDLDEIMPASVERRVGLGSRHHESGGAYRRPPAAACGSQTCDVIHNRSNSRTLYEGKISRSG